MYYAHGKFIYWYRILCTTKSFILGYTALHEDKIICFIFDEFNYLESSFEFYNKWQVRTTSSQKRFVIFENHFKDPHYTFYITYSVLAFISP